MNNSRTCQQELVKYPLNHVILHLNDINKLKYVRQMLY
jgi:hypothetical protein